MKKIVVLSIIASFFALANNSVTNLKLNQTSEIDNSSNINNGATVSQGQTDIKNSSNVENVTITQHDNTIDNTQISGTNSEVYQGLTIVNNSRLENAELSSDNSIKDVNIINGKSIITQGNLIIGGESNVTGVAPTGGGGGFGGIGGGTGGTTGDNIEITQENKLQDTTMQNSIIHQGLTTINNGATVSSTFKLNQENTIKVADFSTNEMNASTIQQGVTHINGGVTENVQQTIINVVEDVTLDASQISQSSMNFTSSTISNINNDNDDGNPDDRNRVTNTHLSTGATLDQSNITAVNSSIDRLYKQKTDGLDENNWVHTVTIDNSKVKQSILNATNESNLINITYKKEDMPEIYSAPNLVYNSKALNHSNFLQDVSEFNQARMENIVFNRGNSINTVNADNSTIKQFNVTVKNSDFTNSNLRASSILGGVNTNNAEISQGSTIITD